MRGAGKAILLTAIAMLVRAALSEPASAEAEVRELEFAQPAASDTDAARTLESLVKARGIGEQYSTGGLYLMTYYGDYRDLLTKENKSAMEHPMIDQPWRFCSMFSARHDTTVIMGRNWDNQNVGSIIVSLCRPPDGYASVSFSRSIDMGYPLNLDLAEIASSPLGRKLLLAPFYTYDGMNERGLCVGVTGIKQVAVSSKKEADRVFIGYLVRAMLDQAKNVEEAIALVDRYVPFDLDTSSLNSHFFVADSSGASVVLEYIQDRWAAIPGGDRPWQAMTNRPVHNVADAALREKCRRYRIISETLERAGGVADWQAGLQLLRGVAQNGTTWSVIYSPASKDLHFSAYQAWDVIYHLRPFSANE